MDRNALLSSLSARILALAEGALPPEAPSPLRVAIDGPDAAGKTTLADELAAFLRAVEGGKHAHRIIRASIDCFHLPRAIRYRQGPDSPSGYYDDSFDLAALRRLLIDPLGPGGSRRIQTEWFDFRTDRPVEAGEPVLFQAPDDAILIFDGVFLLRPELAGAWDFSIFVQVDFHTILQRAEQRDQALLGSAGVVRARYLTRYLPAQQHYLSRYRPDQKADAVVVNDDPAIPLLIFNESR